MLLLSDQLGECIPNDHSHQAGRMYFPTRVIGLDDNIMNVLDLGCGPGNSIDFFRKINPNIKWSGLDIEDSPGVKARTRTDGDFYTYDGIHMPFEVNQFDLIMCNQVFEHVRYPEGLMKEIYRVLRGEGHFVGSTSYLEPYHAYSINNFTPFGFYTLLKSSKLRPVEIRPGIDSLTLIAAYGLRWYNLPDRWWEKESPLNRIVDFSGWIFGKDNNWINTVKLYLCAHFHFWARKI